MYGYKDNAYHTKLYFISVVVVLGLFCLGCFLSGCSTVPSRHSGIILFKGYMPKMCRKGFKCYHGSGHLVETVICSEEKYYLVIKEDYCYLRIELAKSEWELYKRGQLFDAMVSKVGRIGFDADEKG